MRSFICTLFALIMFPLVMHAQIVISEIMYNPPESGVDSLEFIELYNPSDVAVNLEGYTFTAGVTHEFSSVPIQGRGYLVIAVNAGAMQNVFGISPIQWTEGALNNGGEPITIVDDQGNLIDEVEYSPTGDWPANANGGGSSLELCDPSADNSDPSNWQASEFGTGVMINGMEVMASPGMDNCAIDADVVVEVRNNVFDPEDITIYVGETVRWEAVEGAHNVNGSLGTYPDNPEGFNNGPVTPAPWTFSYTFEQPGLYEYQCDAHIAQGMTGTITVQSLDELYPLYDISEVKGVNASGEADSLDVQCTLEGVVHSINFQDNGYSFALIDEEGSGITVFSTISVSDYEVNIGDELSIRGTIDQFNGLIEFRPDEISVLSTGNDVLDPQIVSEELGEAHESRFIQIRDVTMDDPGQWLGDGSNFNVDVSNQNGSYVIRVDAESEVSSMSPPQGAFHLSGIGSQYDSSPPYLEGYQIFPRIMEDIEEVSAMSRPTIPELQVYPNPAKEHIFLLSEDISVQSYRIYSVDGTLVKTADATDIDQRIDIRSLDQGAYFMVIRSDDEKFMANFVKK